MSLESAQIETTGIPCQANKKGTYHELEERTDNPMNYTPDGKEENQCNCEQMTCKVDCQRKHTCHVYWCEKCRPEEYQEGTKEEKPKCPGCRTFNTVGVHSFSCSVRNEKVVVSVTPKEDWKEEFREYFDKTLKPKKPTMKNLDRELCINFIESLLSSYKQELAEKIKERDSKMYGYYKSVFEEGFEGGYPVEWDDFIHSDTK